jgi:lipopolysaccharide export system permease protein
MGSIGRYIFRTTFGAFAVVLVSVTILIWITQALRDIDIMTNQGQSVLVFVGITGLIIPLLVMLIAPIALTIAVGYVLNKLSTDSELIVMNASGMRPWVIFKPFLLVGIVVSIMVAFISVYLSPKGLRELRRWATEVRADLVSNIVQPGRFTVIEGKLTLHIRERLPDGQLLGIFIDDQRDPKERVTITAENGEILQNERGTLLGLANGSIQRQEAGARDPTIVLFSTSAFDLSRLSTGAQNIRYTVREQYLWELLSGDAVSMQLAVVDRPGQIRAEIHDRLTAPLYPIAFVFLTYAYLGAPRTNRQSRTMSLLGAISLVATVRALGFIGALAGPNAPIALILPYAALIGSFVFGYWAISRAVILEPPAYVTNWINQWSEWIAQRSGKLAGQAS